MKYIFTFFICLIFVIIAGIVYWLYSRKSKSTTTKPENNNILFITAENQGLNLNDSRIKSFSNIKNLSNTFSKVVIIALQDSHVKPTDFYNNVETKLKKAGMNNFEYWLQIDTTKKYSICLNTKNIETCKNNIQQAIKNIKTHEITGLYFDYESVPGPGEGGGIDIIIKSMEEIKKTKPQIKLAWTKNIAACAQKCPNPKFCDKNIDYWDYCLGQSYTDSTSELYSSEKCGEINTTKLWNKWTSVKNNKPGFRVPLLCLGGNCQGDLPCCLEGATETEKSCNIDERLSEIGLQKLIDSINTAEYPNLGLWFGVGVKDFCDRCK